MLRFALPSNQELLGDTLSFLDTCGVHISRRGSRSLSAEVRGLPTCVALFQRSADIPAKVEEGTADIAVVGLDRYLESAREGGEAIVLMEDLRYGRCELALAVPEAWVDVSSTADLADLSVAFREQGRELRVATKYPRLTRQFLFRRGLNYFSLVEAAGAMEAAPLMGYADVIADIVETGTTLRENRLKTLADGTMLASHAVLIGNLRTLQEEPEREETLRLALELMEGRLSAESFYSVTANVQGESEEEVARAVLRNPGTSGLQGPTIARVHSKTGEAESWYAATVVVQRADLMAAVDHLRRIGASGITAIPAAYVFAGRSPAYQAFREAAARRALER